MSYFITLGLREASYGFLLWDDSQINNTKLCILKRHMPQSKLSTLHLSTRAKEVL